MEVLRAPESPWMAMFSAEYWAVGRMTLLD